MVRSKRTDEILARLQDGDLTVRGRPPIVHCILCGWLWVPDGGRVPNCCGKCKNEAYYKFPLEFEYEKAECVYCRIEWEVWASIGIEPPRTRLKGRVWTPHKTPSQQMQKIIKRAS